MLCNIVFVTNLVKLTATTKQNKTYCPKKQILNIKHTPYFPTNLIGCLFDKRHEKLKTTQQ